VRRARRILLLAAIGALLAPAAARADFGSLYNDYATHGSIDPCQHSLSELRAGLGEIPSDVRQYDPGFEQALEVALEQRLSGCGNASSAGSAPKELSGVRTTANGSPGPAVVAPLDVSTHSEGHGTPAIVIAMIVLLAVVLIIGSVLGLAGYFGWNLDAAFAPVVNAGRRTSERIADQAHTVRDRLGF
jgi:hypothetical protein